MALRGAGAASDSLYIAGLVSGGAGAGGGVIGKVGTEAMAKIFGEDVGKEVTKKFMMLGFTKFANAHVFYIFSDL